jgi:serine/threonine protein kinase/Tfp pilus assembly protein PilF
MGQVYEATDTRLNRRVALKLPGTELQGQPDARLRFLREARSAAALNHPNIATIYDADQAGDQLYLAMEFIDGESLRSLLPDSGLTEQAAIDYALQLGSALEHAHARGILHRDIKPENVMVEKSGAVKLVDFGIAKTLPTAGTSVETDVTSPGVFVGTLQYAAPELVIGGSATRQSDLYSFGIMLFEMTCGHTPFQGLSPSATAEAILRGPSSRVRDANAAVSDGLAAVIERSIAREPENRFTSATEMVAAIRNRDRGIDPASETGRLPSLAILEFTNLSRDPNLDWLSTGMVETLDADMRKIEALQVVGRSRTQHVLRSLGVNVDQTAGLIALGNRLGVKWIVTGGFQKAGAQIRVTPKIFKLPNGEAITAEKVDGEWENLFSVQDRVVRVLLKALELEFKPDDDERLRTSEAPPLDAYEHYANGRRLFNLRGRDSLDQAIQQFEKAVTIDPQYALAYSGLGSAHALLFVQTSSQESLQRAVRYLKRAIQLEPELGEPYPFLCYAYMRMGSFQEGLDAGRKGVKLQPDLATAHYFYGGAVLSAIELGHGTYQEGMDRMMQALVLDPTRGPFWHFAGLAALSTGQYSVAEYMYERALQLESNPNLPFKFVGALTMLGFVHTRQLAWNSARRNHEQSLESLRQTQHVYRDVFVTLSACGLGEIELRTGQPDAALTRFRHAWRVVKEEPRMVGNTRLGIRTQAGMAAAYAQMGESEKAGQHLAEAISKVGSLDVSSSTWDTFLCQLHYSIACAQLRLKLDQEAVASLARAIDTGFANASWLEADPMWESIRNLSGFAQLVERVRLIPPLTVDLSRLPQLIAGAGMGKS